MSYSAWIVLVGGWVVIIVLSMATPEMPLAPKVAILAAFTLCVPMWDAIIRALRRNRGHGGDRAAP
jgi:hypothetical protein